MPPPGDTEQVPAALAPVAPAPFVFSSTATKLTAAPWRRIPNSLPSPKATTLATAHVSYYHKLATSSTAACGKAVGRIDAGALSVLAWLWNFNSYARMQSYVKSTGVCLREEIDVPHSHCRFGVSKRERERQGEVKRSRRRTRPSFATSLVLLARYNSASFHNADLAACPPFLL